MVAIPNEDKLFKGSYILKTDFELIARGIKIEKFIQNKYYYRVSKASLAKLQKKFYIEIKQKF